VAEEKGAEEEVAEEVAAVVVVAVQEVAGVVVVAVQVVAGRGARLGEESQQLEIGDDVGVLVGHQ